MLSSVGRASLQTPCRTWGVENSLIPILGERRAQQAEVFSPPSFPKKRLSCSLTPLINDKHCRISPHIWNMLWSRKTLLLLLQEGNRSIERPWAGWIPSLWVCHWRNRNFCPPEPPGLPWWYQEHTMRSTSCSGTRFLCRACSASPHTTRAAQDLHAEPSLGPCWTLTAGTASRTWGNVTDAAQHTKLLFMPRARAEPAVTAAPRQLHGAKTHHSSSICVFRQMETNHYSHSEKHLTKITIFRHPCY